MVLNLIVKLRLVTDRLGMGCLGQQSLWLIETEVAMHHSRELPRLWYVHLLTSLGLLAVMHPISRNKEGG